MKPLACGVACLLMAAAASPVKAQRLTFDFRPAIATPGEFAGADLDMGVGFGATLAWRLQPHLHLYGGWDWMHFGAGASFAGSGIDFEETGYTFGLRFDHPLGMDNGPWYRIEAGGTFKHIELEDDGDIVADSDHGPGYEAGLGLLWPMGSWSFGPTVRFRSLARDFEIGTVSTSGTLRYLGIELGLTRRF